MADQRLPTRGAKTTTEDTDIVYIVRPSDTTADPSGTGFKIERKDFVTNLEDLGIKHIENITEFNDLVTSATSGKWVISTNISLTASKVLPSDVTLELNGSILDLNGFTLTGDNTIISAPPKQIFTTNGNLTGSWDVDGFYFEWFGAKGDDSTSDVTAIEKSLNYGGSLVKGVADKIYLLDSQITIPTAVDVEIDLNGGTFKRDGGYTTTEPVFNATSASSKSVIIRNGFISDNSGVTSEPFFNIDTRLNVTIQNLKCTTQGSLYEIFDTDDVKIIGNTIENLIATPLNGSTLGAVNSSVNVLVEKNTIKNTYNAFAITAISSDFCRDVKVLNNNVLKTQNTGIFCRMIGTGSNSYKGCLIDGNYLEDIGKGAIKFTSPSTAVSGDLRKAIITNNIIQGYGLIVATAGISVFRDAADTGISIEEINISNNIVDGYDTSGTVTTVINNSNRGIRVSYVDLLTMNGNVVRNAISDGIHINICNNVSAVGNVVENCCLDAVGTAGVYLLKVNKSTLNFVSTNNQSTSDGINLNQCRENIVTGTFSDNTNYGLHESTGGSSGSTKSGLNIFSAISTGNTTADFYTRGDTLLNSSTESNCIDSSGIRNTGTSARRDSLSANDWGTQRNAGFVYWNTDNDELEVRRNSDWKKYDGSNVTT